MPSIPDLTSRIAMQPHPGTWPIMYQSWGKLLFMHWRVDVGELRPFIPERLEIDTFDGSAWIAITPFTLWGVRPVLLPPVPWLSDFHETNVRTYVYLDGVPGVWFFSLDANRVLPVIAARNVYMLPYRTASIDLKQHGTRVDYSLIREEEPKPAELDVSWTIGDPLPKSEPDSLEFFLTERYCLYAASGDSLFRARIWHEPWPLQTATLHSYETSLFSGNGLPEPDDDPIVHGGGPVHVSVWPIVKV